MPSASAKIEKIAAAEAGGESAAKQIANYIEKKVRNLEKRKMKLDNYRSEVEKGKELNEDQKIAVSKYEQVEVLLEQAKEFNKMALAITLECARQQKKQAKKEQLERQQHEIQRLQEAFVFCHFLSCFQNEDVRSDFLNGENGAVQLSSEQLSMLDQFYKLIGPRHPNQQADLFNHCHVLAENHIFLVEGRNKEVAGTTYKVLKELLAAIKECGYFSRSTETVEEGGVSSDEAEEEPLEKEVLVEEEEEVIILSEEVAETECLEEYKDVDAQEENPSEDTEQLQNASLQEVLSQQGAFNFLQESQIDLDAPHMDPAVVAVHQLPPTPAATFMAYAPPTAEEPVALVNGHEQPLPHQTLLATGLAAADYDPAHPIPTQTFTNQNFALVQNMMLPVAMVPVLSPPTAENAGLLMKVEDHQMNGEKEVIVNGEASANERPERMGDGNAHYRGGFRGRGQRRGSGGFHRGRGGYGGRGGGGYQGRYFHENRNGYNDNRNGYNDNNNFRRNNNRGPRGGPNPNRERTNNYRAPSTPQQAQQ